MGNCYTQNELNKFLEKNLQIVLSEKFIEIQKKQLSDLSVQLQKEAHFASKIVESNNNPNNEISWFRSIASIAIYGTFQIQNTVDTLDNYKDKSEEQIGYYIGKIAIQSFLELINAFEGSTNSLVNSSEQLNKLLDKRINAKVKIIEQGWRADTNRISRDMKVNLIKLYRRKNIEMKFIRDTMRKEKIIDELDYRILEFAWDVRNSMHTDFLAITDIEFSAPGTSLNYSFKFKKGEELYHPKDLTSFYSITEQIIFIQFKILQFFNKEKAKTKTPRTSPNTYNK